MFTSKNCTKIVTGAWSRGMIFASHFPNELQFVKGPGFKSQYVHLFFVLFCFVFLTQPRRLVFIRGLDTEV